MKIENVDIDANKLVLDVGRLGERERDRSRDASFFHHLVPAKSQEQRALKLKRNPTPLGKCDFRHRRSEIGHGLFFQLNK